jgi:hypothetical protein
MSAVTSAAIAAIALIAEEILVTNKGGPTAIQGAFGTLTRFVNDISDPNVPAIPNRADQKKG